MTILGTVYLWVAMDFDSDVLIVLVGELSTVAAYALGDRDDD